MSHGVSNGAKALFLAGSIPYLSGTQKAQLVKLDGSVEDTVVKAITGATNASPIVLTHSAFDAARAVNSIIVVRGVLGNTAANGRYRVKASTTTTTTLMTLDGQDTVGNGAYTSGGCIVDVHTASYLSEWSACCSTGTAVTLASKTTTNGVIGCASLAFSAVPAGTYDGVIVYYDTTVESTSPVYFLEDGKQTVIVAADAASAATTLAVKRLEGKILSGTAIVFSNGVTATTSADAAAGAKTISVAAISGAIGAGHQGEAPWENAALSITISSSGGVTVTLADGTAYVGAPAGFGEI